MPLLGRGLWFSPVDCFLGEPPVSSEVVGGRPRGDRQGSAGLGKPAESWPWGTPREESWGPRTLDLYSEHQTQLRVCLQ